jgi:hypothetical protein
VARSCGPAGLSRSKKKEFDPDAILLAVRAHVRHQFTKYDELLFTGYDRYDARAMVGGEVERILDKWRANPV